MSIRNPKDLKGIIVLILDKALNEPKYSYLYAQLCKRLDKHALINETLPPPPTASQLQQQQHHQQANVAPITTFRKLLLMVCQHEFDNRANYVKKVTHIEKHNLRDEDYELNLQMAKKKMLGNVKFIGELGALDLLNEAILHKCIKTLLEKERDEKYAQMADDIECLCTLLPTIGKKLDQGEAVKLFDQYFERMKKLRAISSEKDALPLRIRFLLQDCIDLRANEWQTRKNQLENDIKNSNDAKPTQAISTIINNQNQAKFNNYFMDPFGASASPSSSTSLMMNALIQHHQLQPNLSLLDAISKLSVSKLKKANESGAQQIKAESSDDDEKKLNNNIVSVPKVTEKTVEQQQQQQQQPVFKEFDTKNLEALDKELHGIKHFGAIGSGRPSSKLSLENKKKPAEEFFNNEISASTTTETETRPTNIIASRTNNVQVMRNANQGKNLTYFSYEKELSEMSQQTNGEKVIPQSVPQQPPYQLLNNQSMQQANKFFPENHLAVIQQQQEEQQQQQQSTRSFSSSSSLSSASSSSASPQQSSKNTTEPNQAFDTSVQSNNGIQLNARNALNNAYHKKHMAESYPVNGPNRYKNNYNNNNNNNETGYKPNSYQTNHYQQQQGFINQRHGNGNHQNHNQEYTRYGNHHFQSKYKQNNEMDLMTTDNRNSHPKSNNNLANQAINALGITNGEVISSNKPIVPIKRVTKPDNKHAKPTKQNNQQVFNISNTSNQYNNSNIGMHNNINTSGNINLNNINNNGNGIMPIHDMTGKVSELVPSKSAINSQKPVNHSTNTTKNNVSDDMRKQLRELIDNYLMKCPGGSDDSKTDDDEVEDFDAHLDRTMQQLRDLFITNEQLSEAISLIIIHSFNNKTDLDRLNLSKLFIKLNSIKLNGNNLPTNFTLATSTLCQSASSSVTAEIFMSALKQILNNLAELESQHHLVKSHLSLFVARAVCDQIITFNDLANLMKHGSYYPLFFLCMQSMHKLKSQKWLREQLESSKILLLDMLPSKFFFDELK